MSSQRGNTHRTRAQKHQNNTAFKNNKYDCSKQTKTLNSMSVIGLCDRCKDVIEWKVKYKKYKVMTQPKKCVRCEAKSVKRSYYIACDKCIQSLNICGKCGTSVKDIGETIPTLSEAQQRAELQRNMNSLSERERRTLLRYMEKGDKQGSDFSKNVQDDNSEVISEDNDFSGSDLSDAGHDDGDSDDNCGAVGMGR